MKYLFSMVLLFGMGAVGKPQGKKQLFIDVHYLGAGKVSYEAVAQVHAKDLATEGRYRVEFLKYRVDRVDGDKCEIEITIFKDQSGTHTATLRVGYPGGSFLILFVTNRSLILPKPASNEQKYILYCHL